MGLASRIVSYLLSHVFAYMPGRRASQTATAKKTKKTKMPLLTLSVGCRVGWPDGHIMKWWCFRPKTVTHTHPSTNLAWPRLTSLVGQTTLPHLPVTTTAIRHLHATYHDYDVGCSKQFVSSFSPAKKINLGGMGKMR